MRNKYAMIAVIMILVLFAGTATYLAMTNSNNDDERAHITAGYAYLALNDYSFSIEHPPFLKQLCALPLLFMDLKFPMNDYRKTGRKDSGTGYALGDKFLYGMGNDLNKMLFLARVPNIIIAVLLGLFIFLFSKELNGVAAGFLSLILFALSPDFIAYSSFVTNDTAVTFFFFITFFYLWKYFSSHYRYKYLLISSIVFGLALATKYSALVIVPLVYIIIAMEFFFCRRDPLPELSIKPNPETVFFILFFIVTVTFKWPFRIMAPALFSIILSFILKKRMPEHKEVFYIGAITLFMLVVAFSVVILDYTDYKWFPFHSATKAYFKGFAYFRGHSETGHHSYLLGGFSQKGWWYYFPVAMAVKTPIATLILIFSGIFMFMKKRQRQLSEGLFLFLPICVYMFVACFVNRVDIGIRHILPVYPFLFVIAGYSVRMFAPTRRGVFLKTIFIFLSVAALIYNNVRTFPRYLSYINSVFGGYKNGYKYLGDSNISWGVDCKRLKKYIDRNDIGSVTVCFRFISREVLRYYGIPFREISRSEMIIPKKGYYVFDSTALYSGDIKWIHKITPLDWIGNSLVIYKVDERTLKSLSG